MTSGIEDNLFCCDDSPFKRRKFKSEVHNLVGG
jgi:hypothetical protein